MVSLSPGKRDFPAGTAAVHPVVVPWTAARPPHELLWGLRTRRHPALLDSAADHGGQGGWSFLACDPVRTLSIPPWGPRPEAPVPPGPDPFAGPAALLAGRPARPHPVVPFTSGAIGCWGYGLRHRVEPMAGGCEAPGGHPDAWIGIYETLYAFDTRRLRGFLVHVPAPGQPAGKSAERLEQLRALLTIAASTPGPLMELRSSPVGSNFTPGAYVAAVRRVKEYIAAGDIYQANLSRRYRAALPASPVELYLRLRTATPAPYAAFIDAGTFQVVSASPECFLRVRGREIVTRPIKGTRPRGDAPAVDARLAAELLGSEKDRAELVMIVDLERNDLGRVCEFGTVRVPRLCELESHPTVHHLVATVTGRLRAEVTAPAALRACFPGGSITGAPKIRAMQIIEELERDARGFYTGAIGYAGFDGNAEWNIAIRTMVVAEDEVAFSTGGAIVADSDPDAEYEETVHKARAMFTALGAG